MGPRHDYLSGCGLIPPLDPLIMVGRCPHTCLTRVNMGWKNAERIGMRSHYVSGDNLSRCNLLIRHGFDSAPFAVGGSNKI
jgi:hypothetical protein